MPHPNPSPNKPLVLKVPVVRDALRRLGERRIHEHFAGYMAILRTATQLRSMGPFRVPFKEFFDTYYAVAGSTPKLPYYVPFGRSADESSRFYNPNVAGSYAPSSLRPVSPLRQLTVIDNPSSGVTFELVEDHATIALTLLGNEPIPGASLAAYLYRDFAFESPTVPDQLYRTLRRDFGFAFEGQPVGFSKLFFDDTKVVGTDIFESIEVRDGQ